MCNWLCSKTLTSEIKPHSQVSTYISLSPIPFVILSFDSIFSEEQSKAKYVIPTPRPPVLHIALFTEHFWCAGRNRQQKGSESSSRGFLSDSVRIPFTKTIWNLTFIAMSKMTWNLFHTELCVSTPFVPLTALSGPLHAWYRRQDR